MSAADPRIGTSIGGYRIESVLGRGGMSVVYLAVHERLKRKAALKVLSPDLAQDETFRRRFVAEWERLAGLDHPNIIPIFEAGEADGLLYIAMRYVETTDLKGMLRAEGRLDPARATAIVTQVAGALDAAHAHSLVHRDVKPANILVAPGAGFEGMDHAYLSDFGLTKRTDSVTGLTRTGSFMGTIDYIAPEQISGKDVDGRADQYALGCVLFECLTGQVPFPRVEETAALFAHLQEPPPVASAVNPSLPPAIDDVLVRALAKDPAERFPSCREFARTAREALGLRVSAPSGVPQVDDETVLAPPPAPAGEPAAPELPPTPSRVMPGPGSTPRRSGRIPLLVGGAIVLVLLVVLAVTQLGGGGEPEATPSGTSPGEPTGETGQTGATGARGATGTVVSSDAFDDPATGWEARPEFGVLRGYTSGGTYRYTWSEDAGPGQFATSSGGVKDLTLTDVRVGVSTTISTAAGQDAFGVSCRTNAGRTYYLFVRTDGFWEIDKIFDMSRFDRLKQGPALPIDVPGTYRVEATCIGGVDGGPVELTVFLDGVSLGSVTDEDEPNPRHGPPIPSGQVGIYAQGSPGTVMDFDDFVVEDLSG